MIEPKYRSPYRGVQVDAVVDAWAKRQDPTAQPSEQIATVADVISKSGATNLVDGEGPISLKQKGISYTELNAYIRPAVIAYLMSQGMPQQMAEQVADGPITQEGSTKYVLAGLGITGDVSNTNYGVASAIFGGNNTNGGQLDPNKGIASLINGFNNTNTGLAALISGRGLVNNGDTSILVGAGGTYSVNNFSDERDKQNVRQILIKFQNCGLINTGKTSTQIFNGEADDFEVPFGINEGSNNLNVGRNNTEGSNHCVTGAYNFVDGVNNIVGGTQNALSDTAYDCMVGGFANSIDHSSAAFSMGSRNRMKNDISGVALGQDITINPSSLSECMIAIGNGLKISDISTVGSKIVLGKFNQEKSGTALELGNGSGVNPRNIFEVYYDGRVKAMGTPLENNDVVRLQDMATIEKVGLVKPDGTTITIAEDGTISTNGIGTVKAINNILPDDQGNVTIKSNNITLSTDPNQTVQDSLEYISEETGRIERKVEDLINRPDVVDIVESYAKLLSYDTSKLGDNAIIRVLQDETQEGVSTFYRWDKPNTRWIFVGKTGDYYTKAQTDALLGSKVDKISIGGSVYVTGENGGSIIYSNAATQNTIMFRDSSGRSQTQEPIQSLDIVNKQFSDNKMNGTIAQAEFSEMFRGD